MSEVWKDVVGFEGLYRVSSLGRVKVLKGDRIMASQRLSAKKEHQVVRLTKDGRRKKFFVHVLVLTAFIGPRPVGLEGCHGDGNPRNNKLLNLRWDTRKANAADAVAHGRIARGEKHPFRKLTEEKVRAVRVAFEEGKTNAAIARDFGVSAPTIASIRNGETWGWLLGS